MTVGMYDAAGLVKAMRSRTGWTQARLADELSRRWHMRISQGQVSRWEAGRRVLSTTRAFLEAAAATIADETPKQAG